MKLSNLDDEMHNRVTGDPEKDEDIVQEITDSYMRTCGKELQKSGSKNPKKNKEALNMQPDIEVGQVQDNTSSTGTNTNDITTQELSCKPPRKPSVDLEDKDADAICMRTRARYSLANFTLDELENFLQETDDEDDLQNVDDEEEYRKFLVAVLQDADVDSKSQENETVEDEDEDNDADFEIELEEALESDVDEVTRDLTQKENNRAVRRPETRQNKRLKASVQNSKRHLGQAKRPLRPLLPILPNEPIASFSPHDGKTLATWNSSTSRSSVNQDNLINGFAPNQIGQLYCLIHEHVQLLVQVFSICICDSSRQHIASQVHGLISEMLHKRNEVLTWKKVPFPSICFDLPCVYSPMPDEVPNSSFQVQRTLESNNFCNGQMVCSAQQTYQRVASQTSYDKGHDSASSRHIVEGSSWAPFLSGPVLSTLDVAPLNLAGSYLDDVYTVIQEYRRRRLESTLDTPLEREPLFPLPSLHAFPGVNCEVTPGSNSSSVNTISLSPSQQPPKKTLAATLVESTKKQSVAMVLKDIAKLAQQFFPLFNPTLFPHKPPPAAVVNRVLFTDAEDELLALGLMEYNTDWKAIQQRFLPCKSRHQIFVRQKNRCSSKAPENPIKAVRKMKTSPLTVEEVARIQEGLKIYKSDWMSVWKFVVPYRDPSLLPRQWRTALGIQKSYKQDPEKKEKRRLYESTRRKLKAANLYSESENTGRINNSRCGNVDNDGAPFLNAAFVADWRPGTSSGLSCSNPTNGNLPCDIIPQKDIQSKEQCNTFESGDIQTQKKKNHWFSSGSTYSEPPASISTTTGHAPTTNEQNLRVSDVKSPIYSKNNRARRSNSSHLVKLAPDLPPVNLPPSVRVVPQSFFRGSLFGAPEKAFVAKSNKEISQVMDTVNSRLNNSNSPNNPNNPNNIIPLLEDGSKSSMECRANNDNSTETERGTDSDLQMHPLLFRASDDGSVPYYPLNCNSSTSDPFSFFSGNQPQLNLSLFYNPQPEYHVGFEKFKSKKSTSSHSIDFHPLLQRTDDINQAQTAAPSDAFVSCSGGRSPHAHDIFGAVQNQSLVSNGQLTKAAKPSKRGDKTYLDLEMHLSSTSNKDTVPRNRLFSAHDQLKSITARKSEALENLHNIHLHGETRRANEAGNLVSDAHPLVLASVDNSNDDVDDHSHPGIIMEQEELSDTDEEVEENVEFECEEMADSEGEEESDCEPITDLQHKTIIRSPG
ncbi:uncharacterized protein LOC111498326 isoform X2 [Cucurbita maxima]|uniref:Uncharacterized protein LOC111498326 isoform X2 n=1 Tax=Cucurbita maxima TaxID=3661 RepID=A0A6J1L1P9_CUCMA|nr:uncharacterized protein LOC111498326 isoform X2 [Cucurbita maxima]